ncbi:hypothetical protein [Paraburkholderia kururiensis]|uniref:hypothetical protein n=1 Tax=Paraburkholderia kururiensis TaxID=984307 RepID=UPI000A5E5B63|nr:hypothetical protein [Paraburkholderia kururiensis]
MNAITRHIRRARRDSRTFRFAMPRGAGTSVCRRQRLTGFSHGALCLHGAPLARQASR